MSLYSTEDSKLFDSGTKLLNFLDGVVFLSSSSSAKIADVKNQQVIKIHVEKKKMFSPPFPFEKVGIIDCYETCKDE